MGKSSCCEKVGLKKGPWTPEEDKKLMAYIQEHGHGNWRALPEKAGLQRCGKSCRLRWTNYLRPDIKRGKFSLQEEQTIIQLHALLGNRWSAIAAHLPRRTDNEIKNHWNTHIKKRLTRMGIDPVTHKPKTHTFGSPKDAANLSHMAQWESARLEAEARLVRESKPVVPNGCNYLLQQQLSGSALPHISGGNASRPQQAQFCLDVLKSWEGAREKSFTPNGSDNSSILNSLAFTSDDLESPTSIFNFPNSTQNAEGILPYKGDHLAQENGGSNWNSLEKQTQTQEFRGRQENPIPTFQEMTNCSGCSWFGENSFSVENENVTISNPIIQNYSSLLVNDNNNNGIIGQTSFTAEDNFDSLGNSFEVNKNYCSSILSFVNATTYGSPSPLF